MSTDVDPPGSPPAEPGRPLWGPAPQVAAVEAPRPYVPDTGDDGDHVPPHHQSPSDSAASADLTAPSGYTAPPPFFPPPSHPPSYLPPAGQAPSSTEPVPDRRPLLIAAAVGAVVITVGAVVVISASSLSAGRAPSASPTSTVVGSGAPSGGGYTAGPTYSQPSYAPSATAPALVSTSGIVTLDAALVSQPAAQTVLELLDRHFSAINSRDYAAWATTVVAVRAQHQPAGSWLQAYRSTSDSSVEITSLTSSGADSVVAGVRFVSTQDVADAPADLQAPQICWESQWPIVGLSTGGRIEAPPKGTTSDRAC